METQPPTAVTHAQAVRDGRVKAADLCRQALDHAEALGGDRSGFTRLLRRRAMLRAEAVDKLVEAGLDPGPLAGVPFGAADLFDVSGEITTAGSGTRHDAPFASRDATAIRLLEAAGAVLIGTQNMDEFGYGFVTMNAHFGTTRNPHDPTRVAGGAAGGSAVAVATQVVPFSLAFDTNGSLRVPAALCGVIGLKPTYGALPRGGCFPFVESLDVVGALARDLDDLALVYAILRDGASEREAGREPVRFGRLMSWFDDNIAEEMRAPLHAFWNRLGRITFELEHSEIARAAASVIIAAEGGSLHRPGIEQDPMAFEAPVRGRMLAGILLPSEDYLRAQRFRAWIQERLRRQFELCDVLFTPAAPGYAPTIADPVMLFGGEPIPARSHLGIYTQPISLMGLPALVLPLAGDFPMPLGIQLISAAGNEPVLFRAARELIDQGLCAVPGLPAR
ncbi:AtzE family amidohydrolase [Sphingomonas sp. NFR15]|uniref:AtzE family amidohydrolase n=1 Tax=Sphingomonas sp. NFR15 TaxID=1566282 RepID=UPI00087EF98F|nr:AtzE family amidohydrolase [Sphingomonas sp. NFR15]SDA16304.1 aspartyl-tRNA(Asn)/glutamyl-tRNA(Gln) amidotransferase subunit A [Sphingomonas sp. NFR15]